jgi:hypothetical protein
MVIGFRLKAAGRDTRNEREVEEEAKHVSEMETVGSVRIQCTPVMFACEGILQMAVKTGK